MNKWQIKLACVLLAVLIFFIFLFSSRQGRTVTLPLNVVLPEDFKADSLIPNDVNLIITGSEERIYMVDVSNIKVSVDFSKVDSEGIKYAPVELSFQGYDKVINTSLVNFSLEPSNIRVYFSSSK